MDPVASMHITTSSWRTSGLATAATERTLTFITVFITAFGMKVVMSAAIWAVILFAPLSIVKLASTTGPQRLADLRVEVALRGGKRPQSASFRRDAARTAVSAASCSFWRSRTVLL